MAVLFEQLFGFFEGGYAGVNMGEEFFDFGDDAFLLFGWGYRNLNIFYNTLAYIGLRPTFSLSY